MGLSAKRVTSLGAVLTSLPMASARSSGLDARGAVTDGTEWEQGFIDLHRENAVRILDFSHAAEYVAAAGQAVLGEGTPHFHAWLKDTLHKLKHGQPERVRTTLRDMQTKEKARGPGHEAVVETIQKSLTYLEKRQDHMDYAHFQAEAIRSAVAVWKCKQVGGRSASERGRDALSTPTCRPDGGLAQHCL